jgi:nucleotide-binding universal stress UspA family protein
MAQRILFATDGSDDAAAACRLLAALPLQPGSTITVLAVAAPPPALPSLPAEWAAALLAETQAATDADLDRVLDEARRALTRPEVAVESLSRRGHASPEIVAAAAALPADWLVVGARGRSNVPGFVLGSVAQEVTRYAACPVLVARGDGAAPRRVLFAVDGSEHALAALRCVEWFPLPRAAEVQVLAVVHPPARWAPSAGCRPSTRPATRSARFSGRSGQRRRTSRPRRASRCKGSGGTATSPSCARAIRPPRSYAAPPKPRPI